MKASQANITKCKEADIDYKLVCLDCHARYKVYHATDDKDMFCRDAECFGGDLELVTIETKPAEDKNGTVVGFDYEFFPIAV